MVRKFFFIILMIAGPLFIILGYETDTLASHIIIKGKHDSNETIPFLLTFHQLGLSAAETQFFPR